MHGISKKIFNTEKTDYSSPSLFLGQEPGLFDTVDKRYPEIWKKYKEMKSLDWDENEFNYSSCIVDFKTCGKSVYDIMVKTLAWQWEADSIASRSIAGVMAPLISSSELWAAWQRISDNEVLHAATYSEIVRNTFENPDEVKREVLKVRESFGRLEPVATAMSLIHDTAHKYALGLVENNQETYNAAFLFPVVMLALERIQFMSSFAVTFTICETGLFQPIGKAVQKIAQDELEVHSELDKEVIRIELQTERGKIAYQQCKGRIKEILDSVLMAELNFGGTYLFSEGRELVGMTPERLCKWIKFCAYDVYTFLDIEPPMELVSVNPLKFMERWVDISKTQPSPQEQDNGQYRVGVMRRDDEDMKFNVDF